MGVAHLWKQNSFRWLASANLLAETEEMPAINASAGVQGIGTGNPGYSVTAEKYFGDLNVYAGVGFRSNESHSHGLFGLKYHLTPNVTVGLQNDGHDSHPFVVLTEGQMIYGAYLVGLESPAIMVGFRF